MVKAESLQPQQIWLSLINMQESLGHEISLTYLQLCYIEK
jgi:hypothetical protein